MVVAMHEKHIGISKEIPQNPEKNYINTNLKQTNGNIKIIITLAYNID